jgi:fructose-bisphosphate aldolase, class II
MLIGLNEAMEYAEKHDCAIGAFNTPNLECIMAVVGTAEKLGVPVIISHAELHESVSPLAVIGPVMLLMAERAKVPVCVHLDHCEHLPYLQSALDLGFTGVMYDGSMLPYEENTANTKEAVAMAGKAHADIEAEIGTLAVREDGEITGQGPVYTEPLLARQFVGDTGIDLLAPSFGTAHGIYKAQPQLDFERLSQIRDLVDVPLVMHGGSGCSEEDYHRAIRSGVRKINYYSYMSREGVYGVKQLLNRQEVTFFHDLAAAAVRSMAADAEHAMRIFSVH